MTFDAMILVSQLVTVFFLAAWLTTGVFENIIHSELNSTFTAEVLNMDRMRADYPEMYEKVAYRRVSSVAVQKVLFAVIVIWEFLATLGLWIGVGALALAVVGTVGTETARMLGLLGVLMFTSTWAGFLVAGNWFCYWFGHEGAQNTHYQMTLWGLGTMIFLVAA
ncbi:MAG: DUF2165 family protein [Rhodobacteraceae bacterium]|nr:DUF2165 family protein [Paracoccaceae bacterium]